MNSGLDAQGYINDLNSYERLRKLGINGSEKDQEQALHQAAAQFEALFNQMWLKAQRDTSRELYKDNPLSSQTTELYQSLLDEQMSSQLAASGKSLQSGGLADLIVKQFSRKNQRTSDKLRMPGEVSSFSINRENKAFPIQKNSSSTLTSIQNHNSQYFGKEFALSSVQQQKAPKYDGNDLTDDISSQQNYQIKTVSGTVAEDQKSFVETMMPLAKKVADKFGLDPLVMVAQAALETGWGKHLMKKGTDLANNLFGIKASADTSNSTRADSYEYVNGKKVLINSSFRAYSGFEESMEDYARLITGNKRYARVSAAQSPDEYFEELQKAGYATDPQYASKLKRIVRNPAFQDYRS